MRTVRFELASWRVEESDEYVELGSGPIFVGLPTKPFTSWFSGESHLRNVPGPCKCQTPAGQGRQFRTLDQAIAAVRKFAALTNPEAREALAAGIRRTHGMGVAQ